VFHCVAMTTFAGGAKAQAVVDSHLLFALIGATFFGWVIVDMGIPAILRQAMQVALPIVIALSLLRERGFRSRSATGCTAHNPRSQSTTRDRKTGPAGATTPSLRRFQPGRS
jgi:hypothetical protein